MRNLKLLTSLRTSNELLQDTTCMTVDYDTGQVYMSSATSLLALDTTTLQISQQISLADEGFPGKVVGLQHLPDQMSVCAATEKGDVLLWNTLSNTLECTGSVESGIQHMSWSPDQEILVLATGAETLVMMTREFDPLTEVALAPSEFGDAEFINVGWGKKETQFHGTEGKQAALKKAEQVRPASEWDDRQVKISWRGDGQFFVVSSLDRDTGARKLRVWSRECALHSTSESVDGVEHALAWKPSGSLIASTQRKPNKHDIIFFEKNGLKHGEFTLPFATKQVIVREAMWNLESTVLCIWCEELDAQAGVKKSYVQLWTMGNYHWYLKQNLCFSEVSAVTWDVEHAYKMHVACKDGQYVQYTWAWTTDHSFGLTKDDLTTVAVIDGDKLLMTPFRSMVVPPPMSAFQIQGQSAIHQMAFACGQKSNNFCVLYCDDSMEMYSYTDKVDADDSQIKSTGAGGNGYKVQCSTPTCVAKFSLNDVLEKANYPLSSYHLTWIKEDRFVVARLNAAGSVSVLHHVAVEGDKLKLIESRELEDQVFNIAVNPETGSVILQLIDGTLLSYKPDDLELFPFETPEGDTMKFPQPCTQMALTSISGQEVALGLTYRYRFYINDMEVANNCTSFVIHDEFLILTTHVHTCRLISKNTPLKSLTSLPEEKSHPFDESIRRVERGSRAVCVAPHDTKLVLQMPRGNLEVVHPRALVLSAVRAHLDEVEYAKAFLLMRKHRINMNLMYDHHPEVFLNNVAKFIEQISSVNNINLFLTDLQEEDVTQTMYTASYNRQDNQPANQGPGKIDTICDTMRKVLEKSEQYLLSVLTCHVRKTKPELDLALMRIKNLRDKENKKSEAEEALKYLLFLVDVNELYDVALGTYDFDLVVMVAEKSNKDPKEYLPFLNNLRKLETKYQKYSIDKYLKRWSSALCHIAECVYEHFDECLSLVKDRRLYSEALKLFPRDSQHFKDIALAYGNYLADHKHYDEAGLMFSRAKSYKDALDAFQKAVNWQQALCMAVAMEMNNEDTTELTRTLAERLKENRRHEEASRLYLEYNEDTEEAIACLIEGGVWKEALRLMYKHKRLDLVETHLEPALMDSYENITSSLEGFSADLTRYYNRLQTVRQEKERQRLELLDGGGDFNDADADLYSDASSATGESVRSSSTRTSTFSTASQRTKASGKSGKSRRKAEKKKWSLREGSANEDLALIEALSQLITNSENLKKDIESLSLVLVQFEHVSKAEEMQGRMNDLLKLVDKYIPEIWNDESLHTSESIPTYGPESTANSIAQAVQQGKGVGPKVELDPILRVAPPRDKKMRWQLHSLGLADS